MSLSVSEPVPPSPIIRQSNAHYASDAWSDPWWRVSLTKDQNETGPGPASFPKSCESLNAAALVWSNAPVITGAHDNGPLIRSKNGFWLAIPTPAAGKSPRGGRRGSASTTPGEWERRTGLRLRFIYRRRGPGLLVAERRLNTKGRVVASRSKTGRGVVTAQIFLLVPQVKLPKRLDLARDAERAHDPLPGLIVANWVEGSLG
jgi:hypothetical protein